MIVKSKQQLWTLGAVSTLALGAMLSGCGAGDTGNAGTPTTTPGDDKGTTTSSAPDEELKGNIKVDGSSTVGPITMAVAEEFQKQAPGVKTSVAISGTGGGFKKFGAGELDISDASRPIKDKEAAAAKAKGIEFIELPVAYDGLSVIVNPKNTWCKSLTVAELKNIWMQGSKIKNWSQVRKGFPSKPLRLYGPGTASGTFDYFTEEILGKGNKSRSDYQASEDDNTLVQGVSRDEGALGYFGFAYFEENKDKLKLVAIDDGKGAVLPSQDTILTGKYKPLSRPLFIYVAKKSADRPEIKGFVDFYLTNGKELIKQVGYVPLQDDLYEAAKKRWEAKTAGTMFADKATHSKTLEQVYIVGKM
jgi:phosphate transport system substrate-binding protein